MTSQNQEAKNSNKSDSSGDVENQKEKIVKEEKMLDNIKEMLTKYRVMSLVIIASKTFSRHNWMVGSFTI